MKHSVCDIACVCVCLCASKMSANEPPTICLCQSSLSLSLSLPPLLSLLIHPQPTLKVEKGPRFFLSLRVIGGEGNLGADDLITDKGGLSPARPVELRRAPSKSNSEPAAAELRSASVGVMALFTPAVLKLSSCKQPQQHSNCTARPAYSARDGLRCL